MFKIVSGFRETTGWYLTDTDMARGYFVDVASGTQASSISPGTLELATGQFIGPLLQDVTTAGISYIYTVNNVPATTVTTGNVVSIANGGGYIVTSLVAGYGVTGVITDSTTHDTELSVYAGLWRVAQTDDVVKGRFVGLWDGNSGQYHIEVFA